MLRFPVVLRTVENEPDARQWLSSKWQTVVDLMLAEWQERGQVDVFRLAQRVDPDQAPEITALALEGESILEAECDKMAADCLSDLCRKRSEEHMSELQSLRHLVCRLLLEKKNKNK